MDTKNLWQHNHGRNDGLQDSTVVHLGRGGHRLKCFSNHQFLPQAATGYRDGYDETSLQNQDRRMRFRLRHLYDVELTESLDRNTGV